jgi:hypothetical protein
MPVDLHASHGDPSLYERLRHRTRLQERNDLVIEFVAIHRRDEINEAPLGTAGVEACDQMTNANRQINRAKSTVLRKHAALL